MQFPEKEQMTETDLQLLRYPALLLNESLVVTGKNKPCAVFPIRKNCRIHRYLFSADILRLQKMTTGQVIRVSVNLEGVYLCFAKKLSEGYLLALRVIPALAWEKAGAEALEPMLRNCSIDEQLRILKQNTENDQDAEKILRKNYLRSLRFQLVMAALLGAKINQKPALGIYEVGAAIGSMLEEGVFLLKEAGFHTSFRPSERPCYTKADIDALRFALSELLAVAAKIAIQGKIVVDTVGASDEVSVGFTFEPLMDETLYAGILSCEYADELQHSAYGDIFLELFLVQMICERNGWDYRVRKSGDSGIVRLSVAVPTLSGKDAQINCAPDAGDLLRATLCELI